MLDAILSVRMNWTSAQVAEIREKLALSRPEFAKLLGVDVRTVYRWESGDSVPSGSAEAVLAGVNQALVSRSDKAASALSAIGAMAAAGGLAFLIYKLIELLAQSDD